jgi:hypothetical protein
MLMNEKYQEAIVELKSLRLITNMLHEEIKTLRNQQEDNKAFREGPFNQRKDKKASGVQCLSVASAQVACDQKKGQKPNKLRTRRQRILLIGDSHVRNCAKYLQHNLHEDHEVSGFAKPGANMEEIVNTISKDIQTLNKKDVVIVWGGSNDVSKNNTSEAINQICKFVEGKNEVNLVLMKAPPRHDLIPTSCVNSEVLKFNRQMEKKMKPYSNVKLFDTDFDRIFFTSHGQHLNTLGKKLISSELAIVIKDLFGKKQPTPKGITGEGLLDITDLNQNIPGDGMPNIENTKQPTPDITDLNQNNPDDVTLNIEISKQPTPDITVLNQNNPDDVTPNIEISNQPTPNCTPGEGIPDLEKLNTELPDQNNTKMYTQGHIFYGFSWKFFVS